MGLIGASTSTCPVSVAGSGVGGNETCDERFPQGSGSGAVKGIFDPVPAELSPEQQDRHGATFRRSATCVALSRWVLGALGPKRLTWFVQPRIGEC